MWFVKFHTLNDRCYGSHRFYCHFIIHNYILNTFHLVESFLKLFQYNLIEMIWSLSDLVSQNATGSEVWARIEIWSSHLVIDHGHLQLARIATDGETKYWHLHRTNFTINFFTLYYGIWMSFSQTMIRRYIEFNFFAQF